jgi:hypothetical protein
MSEFIMYWYASEHDDHPIAATTFEKQDEEFSMIPQPNVCIPDDVHTEKKKNLKDPSNYQYN